VFASSFRGHAEFIRSATATGKRQSYKATKRLYKFICSQSSFFHSVLSLPITLYEFLHLVVVILSNSCCQLLVLYLCVIFGHKLICPLVHNIDIKIWMNGRWHSPISTNTHAYIYKYMYIHYGALFALPGNWLNDRQVMWGLSHKVKWTTAWLVEGVLFQWPRIVSCIHVYIGRIVINLMVRHL